MESQTTTEKIKNIFKKYAKQGREWKTAKEATSNHVGFIMR